MTKLSIARGTGQYEYSFSKNHTQNKNQYNAFKLMIKRALSRPVLVSTADARFRVTLPDSFTEHSNRAIDLPDHVRKNHTQKTNSRKTHFNQ